MAGILVYALHDDEGNFNNNSLGAISEAAKLAGSVGGDAAALVVGEIDDAACAALGKYGATKVYRAKSVPEGLAQPIVDAMAKVMTDNGISYALFGGGLLGFEIGAGLTARLNAGVTMEVTAVKADGDKLVAERPVLQDSAIVDVGYVGEPGIIIGRLNAFDVAESGSGDAAVEDVEVELSEFSTKARMVTRGESGDEGGVNIEDADILVGAGRGLGGPDNLRRRPGARRRARRCRRLDARDRRRRVDPLRDPDRPDRQDGLAEAVSRGGRLRRDPAQGRDAELREHPRGEQGPERPDLRVLATSAWSAISTRSCRS